MTLRQEENRDSRGGDGEDGLMDFLVGREAR